MKSHKQLDVWQRSIQLVLDVYRLTSVFPSSELYTLTSQIRRSAVSIPSNIAEGYNRGSTKEYIQFIQIAIGSAAELDTQLYISQQLQYIAIDKHQELTEDLLIIQKMLNALKTNLKNKLDTHQYNQLLIVSSSKTSR